MAEKSTILSPEYKIEIDGTELSAKLRAAVSRVEFVEEINVASMFRLVFSLSDIKNIKHEMLSLKDFKIGSEVKISMGYDTLKKMITGEITSIDPKLQSTGSEMEIRGYDRLHKLRLGKKTKTYLEMKDSDLVSEIAGNWGLQAEAEATSTLYPHIFQNNQSDFDFLIGRAQKNRYEVKVDDKKLLFKKPGEDKTAEITLEYGVDFESFNANYAAVYAGNQVDVKGWDYKKKEVIEGSAKAGNEISKMDGKSTGAETTKKAFGDNITTLLGENIIDKSDADATALAAYNKNLVNTVTATIQTGGNPEIRTSATVKLTKLGSFSGTYYIYKASHTLDQSGYQTGFHIRRTGV